MALTNKIVGYADVTEHEPHQFSAESSELGLTSWPPADRHDDGKPHAADAQHQEGRR